MDITKIKTSCAENNAINKMKANIKHQKEKKSTHYIFDKKYFKLKYIEFLLANKGNVNNTILKWKRKSSKSLPTQT